MRYIEWWHFQWPSSSSSSAPVSEHSRLHKLTPLWTILRMHPRYVETKVMGLKVELDCTEPCPPWSTCPASPIRWRTIDGCSKDARVVLWWSVFITTFYWRLASKASKFSWLVALPWRHTPRLLVMHVVFRFEFLTCSWVREGVILVKGQERDSEVIRYRNNKNTRVKKDRCSSMVTWCKHVGQEWKLRFDDSIAVKEKRKDLVGG